jgi:hypothetical protein
MEASLTDNHTIQEEDEVFSVQEQLFAVHGEYGNNVMIYDADSVILRH